MRTLLFLSLGLSIAAAQEIHKGDYSKHRMPQTAEEYMKQLHNTDRNSWQKPHEVVMALGLQPGSTVADIGAGTGYFALRFAPQVGAQGKVLAIDIEPKMLESVAKHAAEMKLSNVETILAAEDDPRLRAASVDLVFICDVIHHIEKRPAYYQLLTRALKPGGRVAIVDFHKRPLPVGPSPEHKIAREETIQELESAGFRLAEEHDFLPHQYFLVFKVK